MKVVLRAKLAMWGHPKIRRPHTNSLARETIRKAALKTKVA